MRSNELIKKDNEECRRYGSGVYENSELLLELLLDIRDLLSINKEHEKN